MSNKIIAKINELQSNIETIEEEVNSMNRSLFQFPYLFYYPYKEEVKYTLLELLNEIEIEKKINNCENYLKNKVKQDDVNNFFNIKNNPIYESNNIVNVDGVRYLLIKKKFMLKYGHNDQFFTYKIDIKGNHNYIEDVSNYKKRACCHCGHNLNYSSSTPKEGKQQREYSCCRCDDNIELNYNSIIKHNGRSIYTKDIEWSHNLSNNKNDELSGYGGRDISIKINDFIRIRVYKKHETLEIDNENHKIYWYYDINKGIYKYAFSHGINVLLCKNSVIKHNGKIIPIIFNENDKTYYKIIINEIELSGNRLRYDLLKNIE